jgi:hypothetical protein
MGGGERYKMFKNIVCRTTHKGYEQQKPGVSECSLPQFDSTNKYLISDIHVVVTQCLKETTSSFNMFVQTSVNYSAYYKYKGFELHANRI